MFYIVITLSIITMGLLTRLFLMKKEIKKISKQLQKYNNRLTDKKVDIALIDYDIENLGVDINKLIDLYVIEHQKRIRFEEEHKQAVANMSHDLRTPLTSILGYIQMAEDDDITEAEKNELISIANNRAKRLETLLKEFFELSVIESTDHQLKSERINLKEITIDVLMSFYDRFNEKNREPIINIPENEVFIISDDSAVTRTIENLVANAMNHSDGNIVIILEEKDSIARLIVKNAAYSLTEKDVNQMFDRFYMADQSRSGKSTGLGLSIAKSLMEKMNGTISGQLNDGQLSIICEWNAAKKQ
ncbi:sensor histidine kinase [Bacillus marasmi]|uniref:sensor histidine kinase n=1 Tax=Bacillus marasmi TaxID=1926279 RepID=UPI001FE34673|nr:HAMP domain-containing sensor histidine kinase [Bacillus marasmi]